MSKKQRQKKAAQAATNPTPSVSTGRAGKGSTYKAKSAAKPFAMVFACIAVLFFASGFSSLVYQVVWTRMLVLVFGATTFATSTVLAIFMGGLALGSFAAGRVSDKLQRPVFWYGVLEAIIGVWSLCTPLLFAAATPIYRAVWQATHAGLLELSLVRFICTFLILIVPTTCMGATLPILSRFVTNSIESVGARVGTLYSVNTLGAVVGAFITGFMLLPALGLMSTIWVAAVINGLLLGGVLLLEKYAIPPVVATKPAAQISEVEMQPEAASAKQPIPMPVKLAVGAFAVSGAVAMVYEVCWTRTLLMVIGSSTYAFTIMLSSFLIGIFVGSLICARFIDRAKHPLLWFACFQILIGVATLVSMRLFNFVPYWNLQISAGVKGDASAAMFTRFLLAGCMMAPITLFLGAVFPTVVKACTTDLAKVGRSIGFLYSANTLGAIVGAFLAGFVCLPMFGAEKSLIFGAFVNAIVGLILLWSAVPVSAQKRGAISLVSAAAMVALVCGSSVWDKNVMLNAQSARRGLGLGAFTFKQVGSIDEWRKRMDEQSEVKFFADGACSNVGVVYHPANRITSLMTNGHIDASDGTDTPVQALVSGFPMLLRPNAEDVAVIGWGCGQTTGVCTYFKDMKNLDAIELEPKVVEASKFFHHINSAPEADPRVHIMYNDGRNYMLATDKKYDIIISEPSNPWQAGVCNLFTKEYFGICKERLKENGLLSVWIQTAEVPPADLSSILSALGSNFKHSLIFVPKAGNLVAVNSDGPLKIDYARVKQVLEGNKRLRDTLAHADMENVADFVAHLAVSDKGMASLIAKPNSDDENKLEFDVGKTYEDVLFAREDLQMLGALGVDLTSAIDWGSMTQDERAKAMVAIAEMTARKGETPALAVDWLNQSIALKPTSEGLRLMSDMLARSNRFTDSLGSLRKAVALEPTNVKNRTMLAATLIGLNKRDEARVQLTQCLDADPKNAEAGFLMASTYSPELLGMPAGKDDKAAREKAELVVKLLNGQQDLESVCKVRPNCLFLASQAYLKLGDFDKAEYYARRFGLFIPQGDARADTQLKMIALARLGPAPDSVSEAPKPAVEKPKAKGKGRR